MADLGKVMVTPKGAYSSVTRYERLDLVLQKGSSYIALRDVSGVAPESDDGTNWQLHGQGFSGNAEGVEATDTSGIIAGAGSKTDVQALLDEVADRVLNVSGAAADITAVDTSGLLGAAGGKSNTQALLDMIADKVATKLLLKTDVISQIVNDQSKAASAAAVFAMQEQLDQVNSDYITAGEVVYSTVSGLTTLCWYQRIGMSVFFHLEVNAAGTYYPFPGIYEKFDFAFKKPIYITGGTGTSNYPANGHFGLDGTNLAFSTGNDVKIQFNNFIPIIAVK